MNARFALLSASLSIALPLVLAGCGNKGPLFLPEPAPVESPATPAGTVPVEIEPQQTLPADEPTGVLPDPTATDPLLGDPAMTDPAPATVEPATTDDADGDPTSDPVSDQPASDQPASDKPASDKPVPIDPDSVPDSPPATGTADDGDD